MDESFQKIMDDFKDRIEKHHISSLNKCFISSGKDFKKFNDCASAFRKNQESLISKFENVFVFSQLNASSLISTGKDEKSSLEETARNAEQELNKICKEYGI